VPHLPLSDGKGKISPPKEVLGALQCILLWPERPEYGRELLWKCHGGYKKALSEIEHSHRQKMPGIATAGEVLFNLICISQYQSGQHASLNRVF